MTKSEEMGWVEDGDLLKKKITNMVVAQEGKNAILEKIKLLIEVARALALIKMNNYENVAFSSEEWSCKKQMLEDKVKEYSVFIMENYPL